MVIVSSVRFLVRILNPRVLAKPMEPVTGLCIYLLSHRRNQTKTIGALHGARLFWDTIQQAYDGFDYQGRRIEMRMIKQYLGASKTVTTRGHNRRALGMLSSPQAMPLRAPL